MQPINDKDNNRNSNAIPRLLLTAASSGSGKTMITCGILKALKNRGLNCAAFKCGPDYIDPMFHRKVLGIDSYNLDTFMCKRTGVRQSLLSHGKNRDICVLEGVILIQPEHIHIRGLLTVLLSSASSLHTSSGRYGLKSRP